MKVNYGFKLLYRFYPAPNLKITILYIILLIALLLIGLHPLLIKEFFFLL